MRFVFALTLFCAFLPSTGAMAQVGATMESQCQMALQSGFGAQRITAIGPIFRASDFFPRQERVAVTRRDNSVALVNTVSGAVVTEMYPPSAGEEAFLIDRSPDGNVMLWVDPAGAVTMRDARTGVVVAQPAALQGERRQSPYERIDYPRTLFSRDGARLGVRTIDGALVLLNGRTGATIGDPVAGLSDARMRFSQDGRRLVFIERYHGGAALDAGSGEKLYVLIDASSEDLIVDQEGTRAIVNVEGRWTLIDPQTQRQLSEAERGDWAEEAMFVDEGAFVLASHDLGARLVDAQTGAVIMRFEPLASTSGYVSDFAAQFAPDHRSVVVRAQDGRAQLWDLGRAQVVANLGRFSNGAEFNMSEDEAGTFDPEGPPRPSGEFRFSADGTRLITHDQDGRIAIWNTRTGREMRRLARIGDGDGYWSSPDGGIVLIAPRSGAAKVWSTQRARMIAQLGQFEPNLLRTIEVSPAMDRIVISGLESTELWDLARGRQQARLTHDSEFQDALVSNDGRYLALLRDDAGNGDLQLWNWRDGTRIADLGPAWWARFYVVGDRSLLFAVFAGAVSIFDPRDGARVVSCPIGSGGLNQDDVEVTDDALVFATTVNEQGAGEVWRIEVTH